MGEVAGEQCPGAALWDELYRRAGRRALATRAPSENDAYFASGATEVAEILRIVNRPAGARVLEIGCGDGRMTRELSARFSTVVALDVSPAVLTACRENLADRDNVQLLLGGPCELASLPPASFDVVLSATVFQHVRERHVIESYVLETARLLAAPGAAVLQFRNPSAAMKLRDAAVDLCRVASLLPGPRNRWRGCDVRYADVVGLIEGRVSRVDWLPGRYHNWLLLRNE
jgi:SAM-dependent methyltransferase